MIDNIANNFSISLAGGGIRASIFASAILEILDKKYDLTKIKYISGCSGSVLSILLFYYYNFECNKYYEPGECIISNLLELDENTYCHKFLNLKSVSNFFKSLKDKEDAPLWIKLVKNLFYSCDKNKFTRQNYPDYIINTTIFYKKIHNEYYLLEFTRDSCIIPKKIYDVNKNYLFGGYSTDFNNFFANKPINYITQAGLSTNFIEMKFEVISKGKSNLYEWYLKNPISNAIDEVNLCDSGVYDILGIVSCLRRKMKNVNVFIFSSVSILDKNFLNNSFETGAYKYFEGNDDNNKFTIFTREIWNNLYSQLLNKFMNGEPLTVIIKTEILKNEYYDLEPYGEINFLFHITSLCKNWFNQLPDLTQEIIVKKYNGNFPYLNFIKIKYDAITINLMYNLIAWEIQNSKEYELFYENL